MSRSQDIFGLLRGLQTVAEAAVKLQEEQLSTVWRNSSVNEFLRQCPNQFKNANCSNGTRANNVNTGVFGSLADSTDRLSTVFSGIREYVNYSPENYSRLEVSSYNQAQNRQSSEVIQNTEERTVRSPSAGIKQSDLEIKLTPSDKAILKKLDMEHREKMKAAKEVDKNRDGEERMEKLKEGVKVKAVPNPKSKQFMSDSKQRPVPSSRIGRMMSFGSLAAGLGVGTAAEYVRRGLGIGSDNDTNPFLSQANMDRIVDTLCKVRGAALKIGQMLSIQDESVVNPGLAKALERVRRSADFMPTWQVNQMMESQLGENWRHLLAEFEDQPFAAASIGQVHWAKNLKGKEVAIKIQYPGVAQGIESDIDNLVGIMKLWDIFPRGMFIDNVVSVAKRELAWEVDYNREAECTRKFRELLAPYSDYYVPTVIDDLCAGQVFTTEFVDGIPVDQCVNFDVEERTFIASKVLELCLREIMQFRYMQTDPNWANFLYNPNTRKLILLDFGASREYSKDFIDKYVKVIKAASENDRETVLVTSKELGFLTGYEDQMMKDAHVEAVMILGEIFREPGEFDFSTREMAKRIQEIVPTMLERRLCPPPEEIYSLHRKLSGVFLLCTKLKVAIKGRPIFLEMYNNYQFDS